MEPIHTAALEGDLAEVNRLIEEDGRRLEARAPAGSDIGVGPGHNDTPLILAARRGHHAVVARLIELGADVRLRAFYGNTVTHWPTCPLTLALLLDAGAPVDARNDGGATPLICAAESGATACVALLLARGAELDIRTHDGSTALHCAASRGKCSAMQLLLQAGADPTVCDEGDCTPLDIAHEGEEEEDDDREDEEEYDYASCITLLEAALAEPERPRTLLKARALIDKPPVIRKAAQDARDRGLPYEDEHRAVLAAAPAYLKGRVAWAKEMPRVSVVGDAGGESEEVVACIKYALGLAYGGGVHFEGEEKPVGMLPEVFVELCELLVPKWARAKI